LELDFEHLIDYELRTWFIETVHFPTAVGPIPLRRTPSSTTVAGEQNISHLLWSVVRRRDAYGEVFCFEIDTPKLEFMKSIQEEGLDISFLPYHLFMREY
jgi:hypothetical protein